MLDTPRTVREVTDHIGDLFDSDPLLSDLWIAGEVLEATVSRSGHHFFTMADENAQIRCVLFRMNALRQRTLPSPGVACVAHGRIEVYPSDGSYQFYVDLVESAGIGLAALELELLRQQLEAEGLFAESRKRPVPASPRVVGVITSGTGAVWHDIQNVIRRRFPFAHILFAQSSVQGDSAPGELVSALQSLVADGRAEVIIIARGGGSASDLAAFNDESLVRSVFAAPVPIVSAIGHETDWTLLDLVADLRAPTPSAAAELVTPAIAADMASLAERLSSHFGRFERDLASLTLDVDRARDRLDRLGPATTLPKHRAELAHLDSVIAGFGTSLLSSRRAALADVMERIEIANATHMRRSTDRASHARDLLMALSPAKTMERGYAFVELRDSGRPVRSAGATAIGDVLRTRFLDGSVESIVSTVSQGTR